MRREEEKVGGEGESRCGRESAGGGGKGCAFASYD